ncbi:MAG TPA: hypothetical protein VEO19_07330, partial [Terriglobia bacterium]|nr:hypothetical protein [Terriglobia bacterium]
YSRVMLSSVRFAPFRYFVPLIEELLAQPVPASYVACLRSKVTLRPPPGSTPCPRLYCNASHCSAS